MFQGNLLWKTKHVYGNLNFPESLSYFRKIWKNLVESDRAQMTINHSDEKCDLHVG